MLRIVSLVLGVVVFLAMAWGVASSRHQGIVPTVQTVETETEVSFTSTGELIGDSDALSAIHDDVFQKWNTAHPDKPLWKRGQKATVTITFKLSE